MVCSGPWGGGNSLVERLPVSDDKLLGAFLQRHPELKEHPLPPSPELFLRHPFPFTRVLDGGVQCCGSGLPTGAPTGQLAVGRPEFHVAGHAHSA